MNIGKKIRFLRQQRGISPEKLGMLCDLSGQYIRKLELGTRDTITLTTAQKLADGLGVKPSAFLDEDDLITRRAPKQALSDLEVSIKAYVPVYAEVSAGPGEPIDYVALTRSKSAPETVRAYRVKGLCLEPEIHDGDTVIVDTALQPQHNDLVVCVIDGQASVKRFKEANGGKYLENNNGHYRPEDVSTHGIVVEINRKIRRVAP
jgi:phage repressor protein C with HTH and peptisase S24 domain